MCTRSYRSIAASIARYSLGLALIACQWSGPAIAAPPATNVVPKTELEKTLYSLGVRMGTSLKQFDLSKSELEWIQRGTADQAMGREPAVNPNDYEAQLQKLFPAPADGPAFVRACLGPMPFLKIVPTHGVHAGNVAEHLQAGCHAVGFVAPIFDPADLAAGRFDRVEERARKLLNAVAATGPGG